MVFVDTVVGGFRQGEEVAGRRGGREHFAAAPVALDQEAHAIHPRRLSIGFPVITQYASAGDVLPRFLMQAIT